jgi:hypothetical protein
MKSFVPPTPAELAAGFFVRSMEIDRTLEPMAMLKSTGAAQHCFNQVISAKTALAVSLKGARPVVDLNFFFVPDHRSIGEQEAMAEYKRRNLKAYPYALIQLMAVQPTLIDLLGHANCCWLVDKQVCLLCFHNYNKGFHVVLDRFAPRGISGWFTGTAIA